MVGGCQLIGRAETEHGMFFNYRGLYSADAVAAAFAFPPECGAIHYMITIGNTDMNMYIYSGMITVTV